MTIFVLVHGACHGSWCWQRVIPLLTTAGHRVIAPDLPGMGTDHTALSTVSISSWAHFIADLLEQQSEPVILVGHSRAGAVISQAAEYAPQMLRCLVYLTAYLIPDGTAINDLLRQYPRAPERAHDFIISPDRRFISITPQGMRQHFYNTTPEPWVTRAIEQVGLEPMSSFETSLSLSAHRFGRVPRAYIECLQDYAIPLALQKQMQLTLPCDPVLTLDTDHSPFYSAPDLLAARLIDLG